MGDNKNNNNNDWIERQVITVGCLKRHALLIYDVLFSISEKPVIIKDFCLKSWQLDLQTEGYFQVNGYSPFSCWPTQDKRLC